MSCDQQRTTASEIPACYSARTHTASSFRILPLSSSRQGNHYVSHNPPQLINLPLCVCVCLCVIKVIIISGERKLRILFAFINDVRSDSWWWTCVSARTLPSESSPANELPRLRVTSWFRPLIIQPEASRAPSPLACLPARERDSTVLAHS